MDISRPCQPEKLIPLLPWPGFDPSFSGHTDRRAIISEWTRLRLRPLSHRGCINECDSEYLITKWEFVTSLKRNCGLIKKYSFRKKFLSVHFQEFSRANLPFVHYRFFFPVDGALPMTGLTGIILEWVLKFWGDLFLA